MISNMGLLRNLASMEGFNSSVDDGIMPLSDEEFSDHHQADQLPMVSAFNYQIPRSVGFYSNVPSVDTGADFLPSTHGCNSMNMMIPQTSSFGPTKGNRKNQAQDYGVEKKRKRVGEVEREKPREVVHVRAKRGQATDSHSLAERKLRRQKINEKLRCLQDLVPGCYKTMGMAVMLDVTITYVRSLQNQIDFLSTKLSAASLFYDFNSSLAEDIETIQQGTNGYKATEHGMEKLMGGAAYGEAGSQLQTAWPF